MTTLHIPEGKPTELTLGELVGHVVTIDMHQYLVVGVWNEIDEGYDIEIFSVSPASTLQHCSIMAAGGKTRIPDLDHDPLTITDAEDVRAEAIEEVCRCLRKEYDEARKALGEGGGS